LSGLGFKDLGLGFENAGLESTTLTRHRTSVAGAKLMIATGNHNGTIMA